MGGRVEDLEAPLTAGICDVGFSIASFAGGERERKKGGTEGWSASCTFMLAVPALRFLGLRAVCVGGAQRPLGRPRAPAAASSGDGGCWQHPAGAGVAAGLDGPALCPSG